MRTLVLIVTLLRLALMIETQQLQPYSNCYD